MATKRKNSEFATPDLWWIEAMNLNNNFRDMLYLAAVILPVSEMPNFSCIAEQIWAIKENMA